MTGRRFIDSNVVIYAYDHADPGKRARAQALLEDAVRLDHGTVSVQVFGEFFHIAVVRKKLLTALEALEVIKALETGLTVVSVSPGLVRDAIAIHQRYQLRYWDSLIVATARAAGCTVIYSEDLSDGQDYGGIAVVNPFRPVPVPVP
jgi:predicted nucleic acid-binding protein